MGAMIKVSNFRRGFSAIVLQLYLHKDLTTMKFYLFFTLPLTAAFTAPTTRSVHTPKPSTFALHAESAANGADKKKVIVLGGDGFCGWPTSLYLSDQGHDVVIVDNLSRRNIDTELGCDSLTPIQSPDVSYYIFGGSKGNYCAFFASWR